jgi:hypothetical protein
LREEYAPMLIDAVSFAPRTADLQSAAVTLRTRGPIDRDMPVYTLRAYKLHWQVAARNDHRIMSQGELALPMLAPGTTWSTQLKWPMPVEDYLLTLSIIRPTGFPILERTYDAHGNPL